MTHKNSWLAVLLAFAMMLGLLPGMAMAAPASQSIIPVKSVEPSGGIIRPDAVFVIHLDTDDKNWPRVRNQFETGNFSITLNDQEIPAVYDPATATITATPGTLDRYTSYSLNILIKSNLHGNGGQQKPSLDVPIDFQTGSAVGEPTHARLTVDNPNPRVTETANLLLEIFDDYGNPATTPASVDISSSESGSRLLSSAALDPVVTEVTGSQAFALTDHEAEDVGLSFHLTGLDGKTFDLQTTVHFHPGPAAAATYSYPAQVVAGTDATVTATVTDVYGNLVEDGEPVTLTLPWNQTSATGVTANGQVTFPYTAPTRVGSYDLQIGLGDKTDDLPFVVVADVPVNLDLQAVLPPNATNGQVPADGISAVRIVATVTDRYGNPASGTVDFSKLFGNWPAGSVPLVNGQASVVLTSTQTGTDRVTATIGGLSKSVDVIFASAAPQVELGQSTTIEGRADTIGFTINSDRKFWLIRATGGKLYYTISNPDKSIYKKDLEVPGLSTTFSLDSYPAIMARNDGSGKIDLIYTKYVKGQFDLMGGNTLADGRHNGYKYVAYGDNRFGFITKGKSANNMNEFVWSNNVNQGYGTWTVNFGGVDRYWDGYNAGGVMIADGKNYEPAMAYDTDGSMWLLYVLSDSATSRLVYQKRWSTSPYEEPTPTVTTLDAEGTEPAVIRTSKGMVVAYKKRNNDIVIRTMQKGKFSDAVTVAHGSSPVLSLDKDGNLWMAWIDVSGAVSYAPVNMQ
jgi:hypothetical protein